MRLVKRLLESTQHNIEYELITSYKRKTLSLQIRQGCVLVRSPVGLSRRVVDHFVAQKQDWIAKKILEQGQINKRRALIFSSGEKIPFLGKDIPLSIAEGARSEVEYTDQLLTIYIKRRNKNTGLSPEQAQEKVKDTFYLWLKDKAETTFPSRVNHWVSETELTPSQLSIKRYKARWGSCNNKGEISLNYLLMLCPLWVIDYVIIHELCHLTHLNHSPAFWQLVRSHCPEFKLAQDWLKADSVNLRQ